MILDWEIMQQTVYIINSMIQVVSIMELFIISYEKKKKEKQLNYQEKYNCPGLYK